MHFIFNTMVNVGPLEFDKRIGCSGGTIDVSDNVVAWNTVNSPMCPTQYTLYDTTVGAVPPGAGNKIGDITTFFVNWSYLLLSPRTFEPRAWGGHCLHHHHDRL